MNNSVIFEFFKSSTTTASLFRNFDKNEPNCLEIFLILVLKFDQFWWGVPSDFINSYSLIHFLTSC